MFLFKLCRSAQAVRRGLDESGLAARVQDATSPMFFAGCNRICSVRSDARQLTLQIQETIAEDEQSTLKVCCALCLFSVPTQIYARSSNASPAASPRRSTGSSRSITRIALSCAHGEETLAYGQGQYLER